MSREKLVSILASLDTPSLIKALQANGINVDMPQGGDGGILGDMGAGQDEKIQSWNDRPIKMKGSSERPSLTDKQWLESPQGDPAVDEFLGGGDTDLTPFMPTGEGGEC